MCAMPRIADPQNYCGAIYDAWNRLVQYGDAAGTWYYRYDGLNRRVGKKSNLDGATWRHYYYNDQWQCLEERTENPVPPYGLRAYPSHRYVWGLRYVDDLILRQRDVTSDGTIDETLYALQDANFNVVALAEPDGDIVERFVYDAYGKVSVRNANFTVKGNGLYSDSGYAWEIFYTGQRLDRESGLMYYRNRYYHTGLGRFVNRDPIGYFGSKWNLYEYVGGRPCHETDPFGLGNLRVFARNLERLRLLDEYVRNDQDREGPLPLPPFPPRKQENLLIPPRPEPGPAPPPKDIFQYNSGDCEMGPISHEQNFGTITGWGHPDALEQCEQAPCPEGQTRFCRSQVLGYKSSPPGWPYGPIVATDVSAYGWCAACSGSCSTYADPTCQGSCGKRTITRFWTAGIPNCNLHVNSESTEVCDCRVD